MIMMCQGRFIFGTKFATLVNNVDNRGYACMGAGGIWEPSEPPSQVYCKLLTTIKIFKT